MAARKNRTIELTRPNQFVIGALSAGGLSFVPDKPANGILVLALRSGNVAGRSLNEVLVTSYDSRRSDHSMDMSVWLAILTETALAD